MGFTDDSISRDYTPWQGLQNGVSSVLGSQNTPGVLLTHGLIVEGDEVVRLSDITEPLRRLLRTEALPGVLDSLLAVGEPVSRQCHKDAARAMGLKRLLKGLHESPFPSQETLAEEFRSHPVRFPWCVSLIIARREGNRLTVDRPELLTANAAPLASGRFRGQGAFQLAPGETRARAIIVQSISGRCIEQVLAAADMEIHAQSFSTACEFSAPNPEPSLEVQGGGVSVLLPPQSATLPDQLSRAVDGGKLAEVAFLLDGSLPAPQFDAARSFILGILDALNQSKTPLRLAGVIYGEYQWEFPDGRRLEPDYDIREQDFCSSSAFAAFIRNESCLRPFKGDYCRALELGLQRVRYLSWDTGAHHVILVGNSPPHPPPDERQRYRLLVRTTDQFEGIDWHAELAALRQTFSVYLSSVWIEPVGAAAAWEYAQSVWDRLGKDCRLVGLDKYNQERLLKLIHSTRGSVSALEGNIGLPLVEP